MRIHREGFSTLAAVSVVLLVVNVVAFRLPLTAISFVLGGISLPVFLFFAYFFRNPARHTPDCAAGIIAPADGTLVSIGSVREDEYFHDRRLKLSIYMSAFNVHLNRVPVSGKVVYNAYHPGRYLVAFHPKASELNERNSVVLERSDGQRVLIRQIAGILARRIGFYLHDQQDVFAGEELGFIKFGSRCDIFLPLDAGLRVKLGEKVKGGETILAVMEIITGS
jgi:phosphatidylserine decarboxylase